LQCINPVLRSKTAAKSGTPPRFCSGQRVQVNGLMGL
jgi:hypothetical protein